MVFTTVSQKFYFCVSVIVLTAGSRLPDGIYPCLSKSKKFPRFCDNITLTAGSRLPDGIYPCFSKILLLRFCDSINRWLRPPWWYLALFLKHLKVCVSVIVLTAGSRLPDSIYPCFSNI
jgi:hypothetical protein